MRVFSDRAIPGQNEAEELLVELGSSLGRDFSMDEAEFSGVEDMGDGKSGYSWNFKKNGIEVDGSTITLFTDTEHRPYLLNNMYVPVVRDFNTDPVLSQEEAAEKVIEEELNPFLRFLIPGSFKTYIIKRMIREKGGVESLSNLEIIQVNEEPRLAWVVTTETEHVSVLADQKPAKFVNRNPTRIY